ncbi:hypothetical protein H106_02917 [Trichophyton rubrum CBS 735.88]|nr:hypothetical protein H106_02917 [Trichophyton rubrum CBS 735.88]
MVEKVYVTYNQVHKLCQASAGRILEEFRPNLMIAIGGGGYVPARMLRSFLKKKDSPNIPIQAIGLSLYEDLGKGDPEEVPGTKVTRTQWLDLSSLEMANLIGKNVLIVDEVDDTRTTLEYAVRELEKDVKHAQKQLGRQGEKTTFSIFVLHVSIHLYVIIRKKMEDLNRTNSTPSLCRTRTSQRRANSHQKCLPRTDILLP